MVITCDYVLTAGYNNLEVAEYLLQHGADVNAQDKGGLIPLHNAASYGVRWNIVLYKSICAFDNRKCFCQLLLKELNISTVVDVLLLQGRWSESPSLSDFYLYYFD